MENPSSASWQTENEYARTPPHRHQKPPALADPVRLLLPVADPAQAQGNQVVLGRRGQTGIAFAKDRRGQSQASSTWWSMPAGL